jgi:hypothetical protein
LLKSIGIKPGQQGRRPRIHDLRHNREHLITRTAMLITR